MKTKAIIIGASGVIGSGIMDREETKKYGFLGTTRNKQNANKKLWKLDPFSEDEINELIDKTKPKSIILLSALSKVQECEEDTNSTMINIGLPYKFGTIAQARGIKLIFTSTEYVYDGTIKGPKDENGKLKADNNLYSLQKYSAEKVVRSICEDSVILRLPKVYNHTNGGNFLTSTIRDLKEKKELVVANDQSFSPLSCNDLHEIFLRIIELNLKGTYNCGGPEKKNRFEYTKIIQEHLNLECACTADLLANIVKRDCKHLPKDVTMNSSKIYKATGYTPLTMLEYLKENL